MTWMNWRRVAREHPIESSTLIVTFLLAVFAGMSWWEAKRTLESADASSARQLETMGNQTKQMQEQVSKMGGLVDQMKLAAQAQQSTAAATQALVTESERSAKASESSAKTSQRNLEAILSKDAQARRPILELLDVRASRADVVHTTVTFQLRNMGGSMAREISFLLGCRMFDKESDGEGGERYQERPAEGCLKPQQFEKALIGKGEEFTEADSFYPVIPGASLLRVTALVTYHSSGDKAVFRLADCYYIASNQRLHVCDDLDSMVLRRR